MSIVSLIWRNKVTYLLRHIGPNTRRILGSGSRHTGSARPLLRRHSSSRSHLLLARIRWRGHTGLLLRWRSPRWHHTCCLMGLGRTVTWCAVMCLIVIWMGSRLKQQTYLVMKKYIKPNSALFFKPFFSLIIIYFWTLMHIHHP